MGYMIVMNSQSLIPPRYSLGGPKKIFSFTTLRGLTTMQFLDVASKLPLWNTSQEILGGVGFFFFSTSAT